MFYLTARSGSSKGRSWLIGQQPLIVGRDVSCDVRIPDPAVSRRHCEIVLQNDQVCLRDLGSRNTVLVNGRSVTTCVLELGDELRIGHAVFFVIRSSATTETMPSSLEHCSTITMAEEESVFVSGRAKAGFCATEGTHSHNDLQRLFNLGVALGEVSSMRGLTAVLAREIVDRLRPAHAWLLLLDGEREECICLCGENEDPPYRDLMHLTLRERRGALFPLPTENDPPVQQWMLAAPLFLADCHVGVLGVQRQTDEQAYSKADLDYLVAVAHTVSPFIKAIERLEELKRENAQLRVAGAKLGAFVGSSPAISRVRRMVGVVAPSLQPVVVLGETGTGKELIANLLHDLSDRRNGALVIVNCAAIPRDLFESELFGYEKGAFTGAMSRKSGLIEQSHGGTLFLDEIGDLSLDNQARILRVVETKRFRRIGGTAEIEVDFRLVAATNKDLLAEMKRGSFREDLYHRLSVVQIQIPPLRERRSDIPELARHFLANSSGAGGRQLRFTSEAMDYLTGRSWSGNVRELKNAIEGAVMLTRNDLVDIEDLRAVSPVCEGEDSLSNLADLERVHISRMLNACNGNVVEAAKRLGIGKSTLYGKLSELGLR